MGIQQGEEGSQDIHLSIVSRSNKANVPLKGTSRKVLSELQQKNSSHQQCYKNQEFFLEGQLSAPHVIPESDLLEELCTLDRLEEERVFAEEKMRKSLVIS
ncbi:hypothetical protein SLA2020_431290 [Shorea laevis]